MSARSQLTLCAQDGGVEEDVTVGQSGSPDRLYCGSVSGSDGKAWNGVIICRGTNLIEVTSQPRATADLHILDPKKPPPPQTTIRFEAAMLIELVKMLR